MTTWLALILWLLIVCALAYALAPPARRWFIRAADWIADKVRR